MEVDDGLEEELVEMGLEEDVRLDEDLGLEKEVSLLTLDTVMEASTCHIATPPS